MEVGLSLVVSLTQFG